MKINSIKLKLFLLVLVAFATFSCHKKQSDLLKLGIHTLVVKNVIQAAGYTYFLYNELGNPDVKESDTIWAASSFIDTKIGDTLYYKKGKMSQDFPSPTLNRTFKQLMLIDDISKTPDFVKKEMAKIPGHQSMSTADTNITMKPKVTKVDVKIDPVAGGVTIANLFAKKDTYKDKTIKIKGKVTHITPDTMEKNWIHLQDGTDANGKFELVITTTESVKEGDIVTFEGKISLNKDFGYGYSYDVLMEDAKVLKK